jgi:dsDNA-binding SOS-regulon protein
MKLKAINLTAKDKADLWDKLLDILNALSNRPLTAKEKEIMVRVLLSNSKDPFYGTSRKLIKQELNMKEQTFAMNKANIEEKGWVIGGKVNPLLEGLKSKVITNISIEININVA